MKNQLIKILGLSDLAGWGIVESLLPMLYGSIIHLILNMQKSNKTPLMGVYLYADLHTAYILNLAII